MSPALPGSASPEPSAGSMSPALTGSASPEPDRQVAGHEQRQSLWGGGSWLCSRAAAGDVRRPGARVAAVPTIAVYLHFLSLDSTSPPERPPDLCFLTGPHVRNPTLPAPKVPWAPLGLLVAPRVPPARSSTLGTARHQPMLVGRVSAQILK